MTGVEGTGKLSTDFKAPVSSDNKEALSALTGSDTGRQDTPLLLPSLLRFN